MKSFHLIKRLIYIQFILIKNGLDDLITSLHLFSGLRFMIYLNPYHWRRDNTRSRGESLRMTLETLGPLFVKFGQALSTRPDILPADIAIELCKLQDRVLPFPSEIALAIIEKTFHCSAHDLFAEFEAKPLASASMAQVHAAKLKSGESVVVKILRPNIQTTITQDLHILKTLASLAARYWVESRRFKPEEIVREFEQSLIHELDLQREASNCTQLRRNFKNSQLLYVPAIYWDYTKDDVLVMERIDGIPISDVNALKKQGINIKKLAENGVEIFFTQVFRDCFFHADMHPGNIFVSKHHLDNPQYLCVDFGIIGSLNDNDTRYLAENLYAFFKRDYRRVAMLHIESGWVSRETRVDELEGAIRTVCEPIFEKPLKDISLALLVVRLFQTARRFNMQAQPQLILLQKTLLAVEGLGRQLYPELDLWSTAKPFLEKWIKTQIGPRAFMKQLKDQIPFFTEQLPHLPQLIYEVCSNQKTLQLRLLEQQNPPAIPQRNHIYRTLGATLLFSMGAVVVLSVFNVATTAAMGIISGIAALIGGLVLLFKP